MFENILGHDVQKKVLINNLKQNNISHAYLFAGKAGIGKRTIAEEFAKLILKTDNLISCPDYKYICKREDKKDIVIEQIRTDIIEDVYVVPATGNYKVYVIDDASSLNIASQNALLKTLEEPPEYVVLILIAQTISNFLPTILSRLNKISFNGLEDELVSNYILDKYNVSLDNKLIKYLDGSIGYANKVISENLIDKFKTIDELTSLINNKNTVDVLKKAQEIDFSVNILLDYFEYNLYINNYLNATKYVERALIRLKNNGNYDIVIDNMILKIVESI